MIVAVYYDDTIVSCGSETLDQEPRMVNFSQMVSAFCYSICGRIGWRINGIIVRTASNYKGKYFVTDINSICSESQDPINCPHCGCDNCDSANLSQTSNSTLTVVVNSSLIIDCISEQKYHNRDYSILRKTFNITMISELIYYLCHKLIVLVHKK